MAAKLAGQALTDFNALNTLEQQAAFVVSKISDAESAYNVSNPNATVDRTQFSPNYDTNTLTIGVSLPLTPTGTTSMPPTDAVVAYLP